MRNSKLGLRALGLAILGVLSLTAFFAAGAQAQLPTLPGASTAGEYQINLQPALLAILGGEQEGKHGILLVPGRNLSILCEKGFVNEAKIVDPDEALAVVLFEVCLAFNLAGTQHLPCVVASPGEPDGSIIAEAIALPILHGGVDYILFEPDIKLNFVEVELHGATCPLPLVNPVKNSIVAEVVVNKNNPVLITFSPEIQLLVADKLTFGGFPSYLHGSAEVEMLPPHDDDVLEVV